MSRKMRIALVHGGTSTESAISTKNAISIKEALIESEHEVQMMDFDQQIWNSLCKYAPDLVFVAVQGKNHGDGTLQSICEHLRIPYTGSKATAAALINHKALCKYICSYQGVRTPEFLCYDRKVFFSSSEQVVWDNIESHLSFPVVAKAVTQGGSFGIELIRSKQDYEKIACVFDFDDEIIIERYVKGPFLTMSVLEIDGEVRLLTPLYGENIDSIPGELTLFNKDFRAIRAEITQAQLKEIEAMSLCAFRTLLARNYCRIDFMIDETTGLPYFIEINAVPGLKPASFFPQAAEMSGISMKQLVQIIVENERTGTAQTIGART